MTNSSLSVRTSLWWEVEVLRYIQITRSFEPLLSLKNILKQYSHQKLFMNNIIIIEYELSDERCKISSVLSVAKEFKMARLEHKDGNQ